MNYFWEDLAMRMNTRDETNALVLPDYFNKDVARLIFSYIDEPRFYCEYCRESRPKDMADSLHPFFIMYEGERMTTGFCDRCSYHRDLAEDSRYGFT